MARVKILAKYIMLIKVGIKNLIMLVVKKILDMLLLYQMMFYIKMVMELKVILIKYIYINKKLIYFNKFFY